MTPTVTGMYYGRTAAAAAIEKLVENGFSRDRINVVMTAQAETAAIENNSELRATPEAVATGATVGGALGALAVGLAVVGALAMPGVAVVAGGPIVAALSGVGAGAAAGGLLGALVSMGVPEPEAGMYAKNIEKGGILIAVDADESEAELAREILDTTGAVGMTPLS